MIGAAGKDIKRNNKPTTITIALTAKPTYFITPPDFKASAGLVPPTCIILLLLLLKKTKFI